MKNKTILLRFLCLYVLFFGGSSCEQTTDLETDIHSLKERMAALEKAAENLNNSLSDFQTLMKTHQVIIGVTVTEDGKGYAVELSDGSTIKVMNAEQAANGIPEFSVDAEGYWIYRVASDANFRHLPGPDGAEKASAIPRNESGMPISTPQLNVGADGYWQVSFDKGKTFALLKDASGQAIKAEGELTGGSSIFRGVAYDEVQKTFSFTIPGNDGDQTRTFAVDDGFGLSVAGWRTGELLEFSHGETHREYDVVQKDVKEAIIGSLAGWRVELTENKLIIAPQTDVSKDKEETIKIVLTSTKNYIRTVNIRVKSLSPVANTQAWTEFEQKSVNNVLLDFSYAGYMHGESAPPEAAEWMGKGYKVYDVTRYGAVPDDGKSDREAFLQVLAEIAGSSTNIKTEDNGMTDRYIKPSAKAIVYFPEGRYILQDADSKNRRIRISMGDFILRGAGRDKTIIEMTVPNNSPQPLTQMWNAPVMMEFKHNTGLTNPVPVGEDAPIGSKTVTASASHLSAGDWTCLVLENTNEAVINAELAPYRFQDIKVLPGSGALNIQTKGIQVYEYHQVEKVDGNTVYFKEPIMHAVDKHQGWKLHKFAHYANVGVEDLTFRGNAKEKFIHHGSDEDDGGFKLIDFVRLAHSWIRRVNFESVSEAMSITHSANCSAYDIRIGGNRGHSSIRSQASSRIFIGKVLEQSHGHAIGKGSGSGSLLDFRQNVGQYHACGVSKQSMGTVIWNVRWGDDSCFEAHATQPRATLIDRCSGGFMHWRQGGDSAQMPNHMENLTIWNFYATNVQTDPGIDKNGKFVWWDADGYWWKFMPPIVVGFHGQSLAFEESQMKRHESPGRRVEPLSLYEAQLRLRLGYVPGWLNALK